MTQEGRREKSNIKFPEDQNKTFLRSYQEPDQKNPPTTSPNHQMKDSKNPEDWRKKGKGEDFPFFGIGKDSSISDP